MMTVPPMGPTTGAVVTGPRMPRIGPNIYMMIGAMTACAMNAWSMLAMPSLAFTIRPSASCKKEKSNGRQ
jgi:hypothetical protein